MSVGSGVFGVARRFGGGSSVVVPSRYYMGFWPCQQADGDADDEQVTDRSGKGAHATLGSLTSAEAWANAGYVSSLDEGGHQAQIPLAYWTPRFSLSSFIVAGQQQLIADGANAVRIIGNGADAARTGFGLTVTTGGALQVNIINTAGSSFTNTTSTSPYASDSLHSWLMAYDQPTCSFWIFVDAVLRLSNNTALSRTTVYGADDAVTAPVHIGGRPGTSTTNITVVKTRFLHALDLPGLSLPSNLAAIAHRLHHHPRLMLTDQELSWA